MVETLALEIFSFICDPFSSVYFPVTCPSFSRRQDITVASKWWAVITSFLLVGLVLVSWKSLTHYLTMREEKWKAQETQRKLLLSLFSPARIAPSCQKTPAVFL